MLGVEKCLTVEELKGLLCLVEKTLAGVETGLKDGEKVEENVEDSVTGET